MVEKVETESVELVLDNSRKGRTNARESQENTPKYGNTEQKAQQSIKDNDLLVQFKAVEELDSKDKATITDIIDAFIKRSKLKNIAAL